MLSVPGMLEQYVRGARDSTTTVCEEVEEINHGMKTKVCLSQGECDSNEIEHTSRTSLLSGGWNVIKNTLSQAWKGIEHAEKSSLSFIDSKFSSGLEDSLKVVCRQRSNSDPMIQCNKIAEDVPKKRMKSVLPLRHRLVDSEFFPFCEDYDGFSARRTATISASIQAVLEEEQNADNDHLRQAVEDHVASLFVETTYQCTCGEKHMRLHVDNKMYENNPMQIDGLSGRKSFLEMLHDRVRNLPSGSTSLASTPHVAQRKMPNVQIRPLQKKRVKRMFSALPPLPAKGTSLNPDKAWLHLSIQQFTVTNKLKVNIIKIENLFTLENTKKKSKTFVKSCLMPRNGQKQKRTKKEIAQHETVFDQTIFFEGITIETVESVAVRFQVYQKKYKLAQKRYMCVGEAIIWLDEYDVFSCENVQAVLKPYLGN